ncbi:hypothetical protein BDB01DRAFT_795735 [Pilobolus umbonatus]|nr:hypothetical protein BDB01DRAFT_795735 [Pilobolus umbonatus]
MDPSLCSIVLLQQQSIRPYHINTNDKEKCYLSHLQSVFGQVYLQHDPIEAIEKIKSINKLNCTMLLVDLDMISQHPFHDDDTLYQLSCSSSCSSFSSSTTTLIDLRINLIQKLTRDLSMLPMNVPVVVCSNNDSISMMLSCIHAGAVDYLLKPLQINVIKTLFLKLHRSQTDIKYQDGMSGLSSYQEEGILSSLSTVCDNLNQRIKDMSDRDTNVSKLLMDVYGPSDTVFLSKYSNISNKRSSELKSKIISWDFSPFGLNQEDLVHCVYLIFDQLFTIPDLYHLSMTKTQLYNFIIDLASVYHDENPYHNFAHAVDVLQCLFYILCELGVLPFTNKKSSSYTRPQDLLRPVDAFALLMAAIGHDAAHPGVNNMFLVNSSNPLAILYNDRSILENLHSMTLFQILNKHGIDQIVGTPNSQSYKEFRKTVVTSILATDMSLHSEFVTKFKDQANRLSKTDLNTLDDATCEIERNLICCALIKCADISNVARPFQWGTKWAELLVEEFVSQGDLEKGLGMPVSPMNDREKVCLEDTQIGFIRYVALGLFQNVREIVDISFAVDQMQANLKRWESRKDTMTHYDSTVTNLVDIPLVSEEFDDLSNSSTAHMIVLETGSKRSCSDLDLLSSSGDNMHKRLSIEKPKNSALFSDLPIIPTVAMTSYGHVNTVDEDEEYQNNFPIAAHYNHHGETQRQWNNARVEANTSFCQCSIQ